MGEISKLIKLLLKSNLNFLPIHLRIVPIYISIFCFLNKAGLNIIFTSICMLILLTFSKIFIADFLFIDNSCLVIKKMKTLGYKQNAAKYKVRCILKEIDDSLLSFKLDIESLYIIKYVCRFYFTSLDIICIILTTLLLDIDILVLIIQLIFCLPSLFFSMNREKKYKRTIRIFKK